MSHLYQAADDLGFVVHFCPTGEGVIARTMVSLNQGLFTAFVKAPCVPSGMQVYTWIVFSFEQCTRSNNGA